MIDFKEQSADPPTLDVEHADLSSDCRFTYSMLNVRSFPIIYKQAAKAGLRNERPPSIIIPTAVGAWPADALTWQRPKFEKMKFGTLSWRSFKVNQNCGCV